jgi:hypothetical protein
LQSLEFFIEWRANAQSRRAVQRFASYADGAHYFFMGNDDLAFETHS